VALRAVPDHPKFADLKARLKLPKGFTLGVLEAVWHFTGRFTPQGNIGKYSDEAIAAWVEWPGEPRVLIEALLASGWLDKHPTYRLLAHDWHEHADKATRLALKRKHLVFVTSESDSVPTVSPQCTDTVPEIDDSVPTVWGLPVPVPVPVPEPVYNPLCATDDTQESVEKPTSQQKKEFKAQQQEWFDALWVRYWRKEDKKPAFTAFQKHIRTEERYAELLKAFERKFPLMVRREVEHRPCLGPWINKEPWKDEDVQEVPKVQKTATIIRNREFAQINQDLELEPEELSERPAEEIRRLEYQAENDPDPKIRELARIVLGVGA
jgi:hypothetical protein